MSKNVLIIHGSPRKMGNSQVLCDDFARGAEEAGHQVERYSLRDLKINYCLACEYCVSHNGACVHKDDMADLLQKMITADIIVLATPVYFYTMSAQLKTLIDRTVARYTEINNKEFYFLLSAADKELELMQRTVESLRAFTSCLNSAKERGIVYGLGAWKIGEMQNNPAREEAYFMGKKA